MKISSQVNQIKEWIKLLRWNKPSGRLILLIPAGWALWLSPNSPPSIELFTSILAGGIFVSGAGCIANDLWDRRFDSQVSRTKNRPLAKGTIRISTAFFLLGLMLLLSLLIIHSLPERSRLICLILSLIAIPPILFYPTAKRWFKYPQFFLALCWGFSVLIPWAASESNLNWSGPLFFCWAATCLWTFGFDTVYAMSDKRDDQRIGLNSSAISLKDKGIDFVALSYGLTSICFAIAAYQAGVNNLFWVIWLLASGAMQWEIWILRKNFSIMKAYSNHFKNEVLIGSLLLLSLIIGRIN